MKKCNQTTKTIFIVILALTIGGVGTYFWMNYQSMEKRLEQQKEQQVLPTDQKKQDDTSSQRIGGQKDEHGCLGGAGYTWCPSTGKCQRIWEEYCEEYKDQYKTDESADDASLPENSAPGDDGENPAPETADWPVYEDAEYDFSFQYPDHYKTVIDDYGWPHAVVHLIDKNGGQSYDVTFETWDNQDDAEDEGRGSSANSFFGNVESPHTGKYISMTCWNPDTATDCEKIYSTFSFQ